MLRMAKHGLKVPEPHALFRNVLVMDYLGSEEGPSPRLRDIEIENAEEVTEDLLTFLEVCWKKANLVHADFSAYNILWYDNEPWVIDVGQAVTDAHPNADKFLVRDVTRLVEWAKKQGVDIEVADALARVLY